MYQNYWIDYYSQHKFMPPSNFALFVNSYLPSPTTITDVGCGNGRDSLFFLEKGHYVISVDCVPISPNPNITFIKSDACFFNYTTRCIYARWLLHSLTTKECQTFLSRCAKKLATKGMLFLEFRTINDTSQKTPNHFRRLTNHNIVRDYLVKKGFSIAFFRESLGWSNYNNNNPLLARIVAIKT